MILHRGVAYHARTANQRVAFSPDVQLVLKTLRTTRPYML